MAGIVFTLGYGHDASTVPVAVSLGRNEYAMLIPHPLPQAHINRWRGQGWGLILLAAGLNVSGCGRTQPPAVDPAPFEAAIEHYLVRNGMQLRVKALRTAPVVEGRRAVMSASMTHADLGGPSVVWEFQFEQSADGRWSVVAHTD